MRFEWDENKNARNLRKHGVRFELRFSFSTIPMRSPSGTSVPTVKNAGLR